MELSLEKEQCRGNEMDDLISRQAAINALGEEPEVWEDPYTLSDEYTLGRRNQWREDKEAIINLSAAQPTLYGYKIEHLAYIARVMEKEGVTADYAVRTFDDISRALRMIIEEAQGKVMEALNERYDLQTGGD